MTSIRRSSFLIILWLSISIFGIISIYSASMPEMIVNGAFPFKTALIQFGVFIFSIFILIFMIKKRKKTYNLIVNLIDILFYISIISLVLVAVIGSDRGGAKMVIDLYIIDFQPVELYKITLILYLSKHLSSKNRPKNFSSLVILFLKSLVGIILLAMQPDLGGLVIVGAVAFFMICLNGEYIYSIFKVTIGAIILGFLSSRVFMALNILKPHQLQRITAWLDPFSDTADTGWGIIQALIATSNGNVFGSGYLASIQKTIFKTGASTDYIFVIICEEWGIIGAFVVIVSLTVLAYMCMLIGNSAKNRFGMLYCYGFALLILFQTFINIGGVVNLIPMTGVTLPFISSGLNSYVFLSLGLFIVVIIDLEAAREKKKIKEQSDKLFL